MYSGEYTWHQSVILTELNLNMQARDLERMEHLEHVADEMHFDLFGPAETLLRVQLEDGTVLLLRDASLGPCVVFKAGDGDASGQVIAMSARKRAGPSTVACGIPEITGPSWLEEGRQPASHFAHDAAIMQGAEAAPWSCTCQTPFK